VRRLPGALAAGLCAALAGCGGGSPTEPAASPSAPPAGTCSDGEPVPGNVALALRTVASGLSSPLDLQSPPGDRARLFVVERGGRIRIVKNGQLLSTSFLDVSGRVSSGGERGLLGLAFHPSYAQNGRFFVNYTDPNGDTRISEFRVSSGDPDAADPGSERVLVRVNQPFSNHNGGGLAFGSDGKLYAGLGDGGSGGDPLGNGQNLATRLGKMLRLDVDGPRLAPADNPFVAVPGAEPEIWAYGLRNPWRFSFDRETGDLYIGDVGQGDYEEIDVETTPRRGGQNYGWNVMEGTHCYNAASCSMAGLTLPVLDYGHDQGCSVTGGVVYRGCRLPGYAGTYFYGDYCSASVRSFRFQNGAVTDQRDWSNALGGLSSISSFGVDAEGEVYVLDLNRGTVSKVVPAG
jgi:glucose/arabinose dehydrogenase